MGDGLGRARQSHNGKSMRVFIGLTEIANVAYTYATAFRDLGIETYTAVTSLNPYYPDSAYDVVLSTPPSQRLVRGSVGRALERLSTAMPRGLATFRRAVATCDVFIFLFASSFLPRYRDYWLLKRLGKRIVSVFLGSDVRYWDAYTQEARLLGVDGEIAPYLELMRRHRHGEYEVKLGRVRAAERYADLILSLPEMGQLQVRPYMRVNIPINLARYRCEVPDREVPLVLHVPSHRGVKGTEYVLAAVERLKQQGVAFDFRLVERTANARVRELLAESDIVVDQLYSETIATLALEALASGNVVLARYLPERSRIPATCPVVNVTIETLDRKLRELIVDRQRRRRIAHAGREYVERHHGHVGVAREILDWLNPAGIPQYDFVPTFFQSHFIKPTRARRRGS